ncbi:hypothetical protein V1509DRAFT_622988 [Lipomyces kononenkoae]
MQASIEKSAVFSHGEPYVPGRRARIPLSCAPCRNRKLKCDRQQPCQNCTIRNQPGACIFAGSQNRAPSTRSPAENMQLRINRLEALVTSLASQKRNERESSLWPGGMPSLDDISSVRTAEIAASKHTKKRQGMLNVHDGRSVYIGTAHWSDVLHELNALKTSWGQVQEEQDEATLLTSFASASVDGPSLLSGPVKPVGVSELLATIPAKPAADKLIARFFDDEKSPVPALHTLHRPTFLKQYEDHWKCPSSTKLMWLGLLFSILSLSMSSYGYSNDEPPEYEGISRSLSELYRQRTVQCLMMADITKYLPYTVETLIYHGFAEQLGKKNSTGGWWIMEGALIRVAIQMGYHRDPSHYPNISVFQGEMRRRIWRFILTVDAASSFAVGLPKMIQAVHHDAAEPRNIHDWELYEEMTELPPSRPLSEETPVSYLIVKSRVFRPLGAVADFICSLQPDLYDVALQIDKQLWDAHSQIPPGFRMQDLDESKGESYSTVTRRIQLELKYNQGMCVLHRRFLVPGRVDHRFARSRERCIDSAMNLLNLQNILYEFATKADPGETPQYGHRVSCTNQGFILPAVILCLDLRHKQKGLAESGSLGLWGPDFQQDAMLKALRTAYKIWNEVRDSSSETRQVSRVLSRLLQALGLDVAEDSPSTSLNMVPQSSTSGEGSEDSNSESFSNRNDRPASTDMDVDWSAWDTFLEASGYEDAYGAIRAMQFTEDGYYNVNPYDLSQEE